MTTALYHNIERPLYKWVETKTERGTSGSSIPNGREILTVRVDVDMAEIAKRLGKQAAGNKNGISKFLHGLIRVEIVERAKVGAA